MSLPPTYVEGFHDKEAVLRMPYRALGKTGLQVSILSLGASSLGSVFREADESECLSLVKEAIRAGINYIDVAPFYGQTKAELVLGKALKDIPRQAYYLATKVGRYGATPEDMFDHSRDRTLRSIDESLARLGIGHVDVLQVHDMEYAPSLDIIINDTLPAVAEIKATGKCRFIGITGYPLENFRTVLERSSVPIDTILTYCRYTLNDSTLLTLLEFLQERGVGIVNASPISMGLLSHRGPPAWHPATDEIKVACRQAADYCQQQDVNISKLAMHYTLAHEAFATTLVSTASKENLRRNLAAVSETLTDHERRVTQHIIETFFKPLTSPHWEGTDVERHWAALGGRPK